MTTAQHLVPWPQGPLSSPIGHAGPQQGVERASIPLPKLIDLLVIPPIHLTDAHAEGFSEPFLAPAPATKFGGPICVAVPLDEPREEWTNWASRQADRLDPLTASPPSVLDESV